jgi:hypothetical protein
MRSTSLLSLPLPDISQLSLTSEVEAKQRPPHPLAQVRSVSDTGPQRLTIPLAASTGSQSSGMVSPLASIQAARGAGIEKRPPSSSGSSGSGVSKLPAGMQAKMMAVRPSTLSLHLLNLLLLYPSIVCFVLCCLLAVCCMLYAVCCMLSLLLLFLGHRMLMSSSTLREVHALHPRIRPIQQVNYQPPHPNNSFVPGWADHGLLHLLDPLLPAPSLAHRDLEWRPLDPVALIDVREWA